MRVKPTAFPLLTLATLLVGLVLGGQPQPAQAGCGCDKPPPAPAAVIPSFAFGGMLVTLFRDGLQVGQTWTVTFQNGSTTTTARALVVSKRDITDPTGKTYKPQLLVTVPRRAAMGPTTILAASATASFVVPPESFTVIAKPLVFSEQEVDYDVDDYTTAVGQDGTLYLSVGGLADVCKTMTFDALLKDFPLQVEEIVIFNSQGFLIDGSVTGTDHFFIKPHSLRYLRHSFETYCTNHQFGGTQEVDPEDPDWHLNGTPHVDYSTLIFAIAGHFADRTMPKAGQVTFRLHVTNTFSSSREKQEERVVEGLGRK